MLINPFSGVINTATSGSNAPVGKLQKAVSQLSSGEKNSKVADDVSGASAAVNLQNKISGLRSALTNTSLFNSVLQTAQNGAGKIQESLGRLEQLATQANNGALNDDNRQTLNAQFKEELANIDSIVGQTNFNNGPLLDGSISGEKALDIAAALGQPTTQDDVSLAIESLKSEDLFGGSVSIATQEDAQQALNAIQQAQNNVGTTIASIGAFSEQLSFASGFVETAIANQDAARATLTDADFSEAATQLSVETLQDNLEISIRAQSNRLPPSLVQLVQS